MAHQTAALDAILDEYRRLLLDAYPRRLRACLDALDDDDLWWRPNDASNSVGNLVLHLSGNLCHYLGRGVAGDGYRRDRPAEFSERGPVPRAELLARFDEALAAAGRAFDALTPDKLAAEADLGAESAPVPEILTMVVTHFNGHLGQIVYVTKMRHPEALQG